MRIVSLVAALLAGAAGGAVLVAQTATGERPAGTVQIYIPADLPRPVRPNACLHGADEAGREARRRVSAIAYVRAINTAQAEFFARSSRYAESGELAALGGVPAGFVLQHASRGSNYMVSLKDRQDPCGYTLYSDHTGVVYEAAPVAPEAPGP